MSPEQQLGILLIERLEPLYKVFNSVKELLNTITEAVFCSRSGHQKNYK